MTRSNQPRSALSVGMQWASRISSLGMEFVVPTLIGAAIDHRFGTSPAVLLIGAVAGFLLFMVHILRIATEGTKKK